ARAPERPLHIAGDGKFTCTPGGIAELQDRQFNRRLFGYQHRQLTVYTAFTVGEHTVAKSMAGEVITLSAYWQRRGRPTDSTFLIAQIKRFAASVADRIVFPGC